MNVFSKTTSKHNINSQETLSILPLSSCFKRYLLEDNITFQDYNQSIYQILKTKGQLSFFQKKIVKTQTQTSLSGEELKDYKVVVHGEMLLRIEYITDDTERTKAVTYLTIPFNTYITLPCDFKTSSATKVSGYIEHLSAEPVYENTVYISAILLFTAD